MAQLVARFHGMEDASGVRIPLAPLVKISTSGFGVSIFLLHEQWSRLWLQLGQLVSGNIRLIGQVVLVFGLFVATADRWGWTRVVT